MKQKDRFRYVEKCFYSYKQNLAGLKILRNDLVKLQNNTDVHAQNYETLFSQTGLPSDPVQARVVNIEHVERKIQMLERSTLPITQMVDFLQGNSDRRSDENADLLQVLELYYFENLTPEVVMNELHYGRTTLFMRRRELVKMGEIFLGS